MRRNKTTNECKTCNTTHKKELVLSEENGILSSKTSISQNILKDERFMKDAGYSQMQRLATHRLIRDTLIAHTCLHWQKDMVLDAYQEYTDSIICHTKSNY